MSYLEEGVFANVCILEHLPRISRESYVLSESMLVSVQCIEAVVTDVQPRAQRIFKYHDGDILELTGDVSDTGLITNVLAPVLLLHLSRNTPPCFCHIL